MGKKFTVEDIKLFAENKGYVLEQSYYNPNELIELSCKKHPNSHFYMKISNLVRPGCRGCPKCIEELTGSRPGYKLTIDIVKKRFEERGYELLSTEYKNVKEKMEYRCKRHPEIIQKISWRVFKNGGGCLYCNNYAGTSYPEQFIFWYLKEYFPDAVNRKIINKIEYDIYLPSIKTVIEFDGEYWHKNDYKNKIKKKNNANKKGLILITIKSTKRKIRVYKNENTIFINNNKTKNNKEMKKVLDFVFSILIFNKLINPKIFNSKKINLNEIKSKAEKYTPIRAFEISLLDKNPNVLKYWDKNKNNGLTPDKISYASNKKVWLKCPNLECNLEFQKTPNDISRHKTLELCPNCYKKKGISVLNLGKYAKKKEMKI